MSNIKIEAGGKQVGLACHFSCDPALGCSNRCVSCYGTKTSYRGSKFFDEVRYKVFNEKEFEKSCRNAKRKDCKYVRVGKHTDPFLRGNVANTKEIIKYLTKENLIGIFVSKSIEYDTDISSLLREGNHILHVSLGMITEASSNTHRIETGNKYSNSGVRSKFRLTNDITKEMPVDYNGFLESNSIVTPMRFSSKEIAGQYNADLLKYKFINGYYRPQEIHNDWNKFNNFCGEVKDEIKCCNCLTGEK